MIKRATPFLLLILLVSLAGKYSFAQQSIQLYYEDFNGGTAGFTLNTPTSVSTGTGTNQWMINNIYDGGGLYPNTPDETQTVSGTIAGAPYSNYLHVNDVNNTAVAGNGNYDPDNASDNMAIMNTSFCTLGLTDVTFTFFYIGEGNSSDYMSLYYSIDGGGTWIQTGQSQYYGQSLWKYEIVTDPAFNNQIDLRFAFRWVNGTGASTSIGFGVDDIIAVGTYDDVNNPVELTITSVSPNPVCQGGYLFVSWELSAPLCDGTYDVQMSDASGNFSNPYDLGVFTIFANQTSGAVAVVIPSFVAPGGCYEIKISRVSPPPAIEGTASICFEIEDCPNTITTLQPPVTYGPDTLCVHSVIDVPFYSTGVFNFNNQYIAELSDASGNFTNPLTLGSSLDPNTYDPLYGSPPGSVSGLVPDVPDGCNYYVRVRSTNPAVTGTPWGPFCIHHCDATTNNMQDISVCITDYVGVDTTITIDINTWGPTTTYNPGNEFQVQVLDASFYTILNTGGFGVIAATTSTTMTLSIPGLIDVINLLGPPGTGTYYMRIVATDPVPSWDQYGTLIHLTIGSPDSLPPLLIPDDTLVCQGQISGITISPFNAYTNGSQYQWYSPQFNNGQPFYWDYNPLLINWGGAPVGTYWLTVREYNYGCWGPWSDTVYIDVIGTPSTAIVGPVSVCLGDTVEYHTSFLAGTYYSWTSNSLVTVIDTSNNEITVVFDSVGVANLSVYALNECGSNTGQKNITVHALPDVVAPQDTAVCPGTPITLNATSSNATGYTWYANGQQVSTSNPYTTYTDSTTVFIVIAKNGFNCEKQDTTIVTINPDVELDATATDITCNGIFDGTATAIASEGVPPYSYLWTTVPTNDSATVHNLGPGGYIVYVTDANGCKDTASVTILQPDAIVLALTSTDITVYQANDGTATATVTGGTEPYTYSWNTDPPQSDATAINLPPGTYEVIVTDSAGCKVSDTISISDAPNVFAVPNAFTPNGDGLNDEFTVINSNVSEFEMFIYNRWGQLLFHTTDMNEGWDGRYEGKEEEIGAYVYVVKALFFDGTSAEQKGNVTLLR